MSISQKLFVLISRGKDSSIKSHEKHKMSLKQIFIFKEDEIVFSCSISFHRTYFSVGINVCSV